MTQDVTCQEVKARLEGGEKLHFIDVREEWEHEEINIGALSMPLGDLPTRISELESLREEEIIVHCKSGNRSWQAKKFLTSKGFTNVKHMVGGITEYLSL